MPLVDVAPFGVTCLIGSDVRMSVAVVITVVAVVCSGVAVVLMGMACACVVGCINCGGVISPDGSVRDLAGYTGDES